MNRDVPWWRDAVCYQIYVRSFADSDGDGLGDLAGITSRLPYLADLGVDAIWVTPFYPSPQNDHGYDVADYRDVDTRFGSLADFDAMVVAAHARQLRVIVDLVPNHTSSEHPWFQAALAAGPGSRDRQRYIFRTGRGRDGAQPPTNWQSVFGGPAWTRVPDGEWYLHLFDVTQPDLNWRRREVREEFDSILRFWLDRGVDGFRIDVAHGLIKHKELPDHDNPGHLLVAPYWDQPEVHGVYRRWNKVLAAYDGDRMAIAEAWADDEQKMARYLRRDELQQAFNFHWLTAPWSAAEFRHVIERTYAAVDPVKASPTWVLSNHDVVREVTRYGGGDLGVARSKAATLTMLALPGSAYVYQGAELGLPEVDVPERFRQDPAWLRGEGAGRDGSRVPLPWSGTRRPYGFGPDGSTAWLPQPASWRRLSVEAQDRSSGSTLAFFRQALAARRQVVSSLGSRITFGRGPAGTLVFSREPGFTCVLNAGKRPVRLVRVQPGQPDPSDAAPLGAANASLGDANGSLGDLLITSGGADSEHAIHTDHSLPPNTAAWFLLPSSR
jgi:alpha-glucosidase